MAGDPRVLRQAASLRAGGLRDLCQQLHDTYKAFDIARLTTEMYTSNMEPAMKPAEAFACVAHRKTQRVPIDELEGASPPVCSHPIRRAFRC